MTYPVDMVVAVHDPARPIERAVASLLHDDVARVTVVCHGIDAAPIEERLAGLVAGQRDAVRVVRFDDGIRSAAGPFNHGLDLATADFVAIMGSDDVVQPGALAAWTHTAQASGAAAVLARLIHSTGELIRTPLARPGRTQNLDFVRDRVAYRTAPLGLMRRAVLERLGLRLTPGLGTGDDVELGLRLWTSGRIDYARRAPAYVIHNDATDRTTMVTRGVGDELAAVPYVVGQKWMGELSEGVRRAIGIKLIRIHLLGALHRRPLPAAWDAQDILDLQVAFDATLGLAPRILDPFCRAERHLIDAAQVATTPQDMSDAVAAARNAGRWDRLATARVADIFGRETVLRRYANYALTR